MVDKNILWEELLENIEKVYDTNIYNDLFKNCRPHEIKNGYLVIVCPSIYEQSKINKFYIKNLNEMILNLVDDIIQLKFILKEDIVDNSLIAPKKLKPFRSNINANHTFNNYVIGQSNRFAYQMALRVADQPGIVVNPLYIFGSVGLGKTHLMEAIGNYILDNDVKRRVLYIKASEFIEDYTKMCNGQIKNEDFNEKYRNLDVLLIDDIQTLEMGKKSQLEFFKIFDILFSSNKQIVITSDRPAKELDMMERLISRFNDGLTVDIQIPNLEHRKTIVKKKLEEVNKYNVSDDVLEFIANTFTKNIREIEGAVNRLVYYCETCELEINLDTAREALSALISKDNRISNDSNEMYSEIIGLVADFYKISYDDIISSKRNANIAIARQIAMYILKDNYDLTMKKIGSLFGGRDHSTVISSIEKIQKEIEKDGDIALAVLTINKKLNKN